MWELEDGTSMGLRRMYECAHFFTAWKSAPPTEDGRGKVDRCEWKVRAERSWRNMYTRSERNCVNSAGTTTNNGTDLSAADWRLDQLASFKVVSTAFS